MGRGQDPTQLPEVPCRARLRRVRGNDKLSDSPFRRMIRASEPDFWRLWCVGLVVFTVRWLETVAVGVVVYQRSGSAFLVAMMTMLRLLPMGLFGVFLGALAERFDRRATLIGVVLLMGATSATLAVLAWTGSLQVWHLAVASFVNGCGWATDNPVRRVMMGEVVGREHMGTAMSLDVGANNASRMVGPSIGRVSAGGRRHRGRVLVERGDVSGRSRRSADGAVAHCPRARFGRRARPNRRGAGDRARRQATDWHA